MSASFPRSTPSIPFPFERAEDDAVLQRDRRAEHAADRRFPKNSYQAFFARNELEHADRRIHEFVRKVHSQFIGNAPSLSIKPPQRMHALAVPYSGLVLVTHPCV